MFACLPGKGNLVRRPIGTPTFVQMPLEGRKYGKEQEEALDESWKRGQSRLLLV